MYEQAQTDSDGSWGPFSLRGLMILVTIFSVMLVLIAVPMAFAALYVGLTGILAIAIWEGRGWIRAFAVGALLPHLSGYLLALASRRPSDLVAMLLVVIVVSCVSGIAAAAFRTALARHSGTLPAPNLPLLRDWLTNDSQA